MCVKLKFVVRAYHKTVNDDAEVRFESSRVNRFDNYEAAVRCFESEKAIISLYADIVENSFSCVYLEYSTPDIGRTLEYAEAFDGNFLDD